MHKQFLATDFDGTLWRNGRISDEDRAAIHRWRKSGRLFGFVTGRGIHFPKHIRGLGLQGDFYVCYNGALLMNHDGEILKEARMDKPVFAALEDAFRQNGIAFDYDLANEESDFFQYSGLMPTCGQAADFAAELDVRFSNQVSAYANGLNINIVKRGVSKAAGIRHALQHLGLSEDQAAVVGDDLNDLDMIVSLNGWAVDSARPQVIEKVPHLCRSVGALIDELMIT